MFRPTLALLKNTSRSARNAKRLQTGLYDGRSIQSGNNVGETFNNKTRRTWLPNVQFKNVWSEALGQKLKLKVTTGALRTIDKVGGLDAYLFRMKPERLGDKGMQLRQMVKEAHARAKVERRAMAEASLQDEVLRRSP
ncbi:SPOSA6832_01824 [Sporobolomyces salmonicolor]|uniref:Large ribosomal subunit protein bL28m n=1 Tax=Sporidiobolus salmonicolor TaxID=5005 RepID=A0A0D6EKU5_SPOSA|nr:SPOSA6832_01824 [Sporobolomyces salmonicolor]